MPSHFRPRPIDAAYSEAARDWSAFVDAQPFPMAIVDEDGMLVAANHDLRQEWQPSPDGPFADVFAVEERAKFGRLITSAIAKRSLGRGELRVGPAAGETRWAQVTAAPLANRDDETPKVAIQLFDVTEQRRAVDTLAERERRWDGALISSESGVWDHNWATGQKYYSPMWRKIRGMSEGDPLAASTAEWLALVHPDDQTHVMHCMARQNAGDPAYHVFEYRERHKLGHWVWIQCRGACVEWDENGKPTRIVGTDTDVTDRKAAEEGMARMSRRLEMALDISGIGVFEADFDTGEVDWDERMLSIYHLQERERVEIGGLWESFLHPEDAGRVLANVEKNLASGGRFSDEYRVFLRDGSERVIRTRTMAFTDGRGHHKIVGANWDITSDVTLHRELERAKTLAEARNQELESAKVRIEHNAMHDYLTDLPNRRYLDEMLYRVASECERSAHSMAILHIDLDRFKQINDTLGHSAGDSMLRHVARVLKATIRKGDFVARIGGDEFVVVSKFNGSPRKLSNLADRLILELRKPVSYEGHDCRFGASIGIACAHGPEIDARQLLLNADIALYRAKHSGRNRHEFFSTETQNEIVTMKRLSDEILRALERHEFVPYYQPQFDARTLDIVGVETLVRWMHPQHGVLPPDRFLPAAEELNVVSTIDALILDSALQDFRIWRDLGLNIPKVSVNVSSRRLHDTSLARKLKKLDIEPGTISFELLESIFLDDCDRDVMRNLTRLKKLGIDLEIDDFGTGHASIIGLLKLNPAALKIDRELVRHIVQSQEQRRMVGSIIEIGRSLNIKVVAEGVETTEHVRVLRDLGCDTLQGYALARPMPRTMVADFVRGQSWRQPNGQAK